MQENRLCFATNNKGKLQEINALISDWTILSLQEIGCHEELPETHNTLEENSLEKADHVFKNYGVNCFADDTGLEVDALNGEPGVFSARWAGPGCTPLDNMNLLLKKMEGIQNRKARFRAVITLILNGKVHQFEGSVNGTITESPSGAKGFGYDPVFMPEGESITFAEMDMERKNKLSHRGKAVTKLIEFLKSQR
jgi:XTP/dITP diphosphohydrolase